MCVCVCGGGALLLCDASNFSPCSRLGSLTTPCRNTLSDALDYSLRFSAMDESEDDSDCSVRSDRPTPGISRLVSPGISRYLPVSRHTPPYPAVSRRGYREKEPSTPGIRRAPPYTPPSPPPSASPPSVAAAAAGHLGIRSFRNTCRSWLLANAAASINRPCGSGITYKTRRPPGMVNSRPRANTHGRAPSSPRPP